MEVNLSATSASYGNDLFLVFLDVTCKNKSIVRLIASRNERPVFSDNARLDGEVVNYSLDLQLRQVAPGLTKYHTLDWWSNDKEAEQWGPCLVELDLLEDYEVPETGLTDFWMEPGEAYHLGACLVVPAGNYLAKVTFVGDGGASEFWRRTFLITLPTVTSSSHAVEAD